MVLQEQFKIMMLRYTNFVLSKVTSYIIILFGNCFNDEGSLFSFIFVLLFQCVLPINIINEKIYIFMWFWFAVLAIITFFNFVWSVGIVFARTARGRIVRRKLWIKWVIKKYKRKKKFLYTHFIFVNIFLIPIAVQTEQNTGSR